MTRTPTLDEAAAHTIDVITYEHKRALLHPNKAASSSVRCNEPLGPQQRRVEGDNVQLVGLVSFIPVDTPGEDSDLPSFARPQE